MDLSTFQGLLARRGADLDAWPEADRAAALELLAGSDEAREAYLGVFPGPADRLRADVEGPEAEGDIVERIMRAVGRDDD